MKQLPLRLTDEMYQILISESDKRGVPIAEVIRIYIEAGLTAAGHTLSGEKVKRGGDRKSKNRSE